MTTATLSHAHIASVSTAARRTEKRQAALSLRGILSVLSKSMEMARAVPSTGRISTKQMAEVRAIASTL